MASHREAVLKDRPYTDPNPLPSSVPPIDELGVTSAPLKSASFFIGSYCKELNGEHFHMKSLTYLRGFYVVQVRESGS